MKKCASLVELLILIIIIICCFIFFKNNPNKNPAVKYVEYNKNIQEQKNRVNEELQQIEHAREIQRNMQQQLENE